MKKIITLLLCVFCLEFFLTGCGNNGAAKESTITVAVAASLKNCMDEKLIPMFKEKYPGIKVQATYDSSGKLQSQIEQGASIDVFMSAAMKQMDELNKKDLIDKDSVVKLLENKIVLIVPVNNEKGISTFQDILKADKIAVGDPASVPAGQYAREVLTNLKVWEDVSKKASLGTNVTEVLNWVAEGSVDAGIVYSTDTASNKKVKITAEAPEGTVSKVIYPAGVIKASKNKDSSKKLLEFLQSDEAKKVFESYGFTPSK
ncbi:molybdate ABC transporter substrate-binding protein [Clostridium sp. YIM B02515]|uniref:Molybdate ABC transporter substrate-binding protein n=1 Tax=Clostridium rhizosphaerae TaxID=2803861 RepID=A0ABS1TD94_9CLOT|nr:molybdate ABC transporter substrate-binding protein [Clostridium rhizosphaerae]MBL4937310.1 molybdate ABC transporter substrate-binding protein [Clostridium rhizosphaerae]